MWLFVLGWTFGMAFGMYVAFRSHKKFLKKLNGVVEDTLRQLNNPKKEE